MNVRPICGKEGNEQVYQTTPATLTLLIQVIPGKNLAEKSTNGLAASVISTLGFPGGTEVKA